MLNLPLQNMRILLKCVSGAAENLRISKFRAYTGRVCIFFIAYLCDSCNFQHMILG